MIRFRHTLRNGRPLEDGALTDDLDAKPGRTLRVEKPVAAKHCTPSDANRAIEMHPREQTFDSTARAMVYRYRKLAPRMESARNPSS